MFKDFLKQRAKRDAILDYFDRMPIAQQCNWFADHLRNASQIARIFPFEIIKQNLVKRYRYLASVASRKDLELSKHFSKAADDAALILENNSIGDTASLAWDLTGTYIDEERLSL